MSLSVKHRISGICRISLVSFLVALLLIAIIWLSKVSYLGQAISGHFRIMRSRESIEKILETRQLDSDAQNKLKMVLNVREYASNVLGLPKNKSYLVLSEIPERYLGWNVYCAPVFSVEPKKWCFPVAGCVVYRGYFSRQKAVKFAARMKDKGYDVFIGPFNAYSTLGWYDDPLLSSHLLLDSIHLAGLIIHELAHQKIYAPGDSRFNEGFAVSVERAGVLRWLKSIGKDNQTIQALEIWEEEDTKTGIILHARSQLEDLYSKNSDPEVLYRLKDSVFRDLRRQLSKYGSPGKNLPKTLGEDSDLNNAYLAPVDAYYSLVPIFRNILDSCNGNFQQFYDKVGELKKLPFNVRQKEIDSLGRSLKEYNP